MERLKSVLRVLLVALCLESPFSAVRAAITSTGDVEPDPNTWTSQYDRLRREYCRRHSDGQFRQRISWSFGFIG